MGNSVCQSSMPGDERVGLVMSKGWARARGREIWFGWWSGRENRGHFVEAAGTFAVKECSRPLYQVVRRCTYPKP